jgi:cobalt-zinc-cadmium efflux system outer membrane protein
MLFAVRVALICVAFAGIRGHALAAGPASNLDRVWLFVGTVLAESPEARAASEREAQAMATADAMGAPLYNPEIEGGIEQFNKDERRPSKYDVGVSLTIDVSGKQSARERSGVGMAEAAAAEAKLARLEVARRLLNGLAAVSTARERLANAREHLSAAQEFSEITSKSFITGDVGKPDTDIAVLSELDAESEYRAAEADAFAAESDLRQLCGCDLKAVPDLPDAPPAPSDLQDPDAERYVDNSLLLIAARGRINQAHGEFQLANRNRIPDPTISMGVGQDDGQRLYRLSLSIPIPVLNNGEAEARSANRALAATQLDLDAVRRDAQSKLRSAHSKYVAAIANQQSWHARGVVAVAARFDQLRRQLRAGDIQTTDYLIQLRETLVAAARGIESEKSAWAAYADWLVLTNTFPNSVEPNK